MTTTPRLDGILEEMRAELKSLREDVSTIKTQVNAIKNNVEGTPDMPIRQTRDWTMLKVLPMLEEMLTIIKNLAKH